MTPKNQTPPRPKAALVISAGAVVLFCIFIFYMSSQPSDDSDAKSMGVVYHIANIVAPKYQEMSALDQSTFLGNLNHLVRKTAHFGEYALLGILVANLLYQIRRLKRKPESNHIKPLLQLGLLAWLLTTAYAVTDEIHQLFVPGRAGMISDVLLDSCGALTGVALYCVILALIQHARAKS